jgi:pimeloyl-ACP methyl ester carboxylesterase
VAEAAGAVVRRADGQGLRCVDCAAQPHLGPADVAIEAESFRQFDRAAISAALGGTTETVPATMLVPSLVVLADRSRLVKPALAESLRNMGFEIRIVAGAGHTVNRDDFTGFMAAVEDWL